MWILSIALSGLLSASAADWSLQLKWGDSIPAGTVYSITLESTGELQAERAGLPFTDEGLTVVRHRRQLSAEAAAAILDAAVHAVRSSDLDKTQGQMPGDGGFASVQVQKGTVSLGLGLSHLSSSAEAGDAWHRLLARVRESLPRGFVK